MYSKQLNQTAALTGRLVRAPVLSARYITGSPAFAPETTTSEISQGTWFCVQAVEVGTSLADGDVALVWCRSSRSAAFVRSFQDRVNYIGTGDEKCALYANIKCRGLWSPLVSTKMLQSSLCSV